jgi:hypothetical protein
MYAIPPWGVRAAFGVLVDEDPWPLPLLEPAHPHLD